MAPMKRPAAASMGGPAKKPASAKVAAANAMKEKLACISDALLAAEGIPPAVGRMLAGTLTHTLTIYKADRHPRQNEVVEMIGGALSTAEETLVAAIAAADAKVNEAKASQEAKSEESNEAEKKVTEAQTNFDDKEKEQLEADDAQAKAKEALDTATASQQQVEKAIKAAEKRKAVLESAMAMYNPLKEGTETNVPKAVKSFISKLKELGFDSSLLDSAPKALSRPKDERGEFDVVVFAQLEEDCKSLEEACSKEQAEKETEKAGCAEKITEAESGLTAASAAFDDKVKEVKAAMDQLKEAKAALKAAKQSVKQAGPAIKEAEFELEACQANLEEFKTGPKAAFEDLSEYAPPVEEEEEEEPEPVAAETEAAAMEEDAAAAPEEAAAEEAAPAAEETAPTS